VGGLRETDTLRPRHGRPVLTASTTRPQEIKMFATGARDFSSSSLNIAWRVPRLPGAINQLSSLPRKATATSSQFGDVPRRIFAGETRSGKRQLATIVSFNCAGDPIVRLAPEKTQKTTRKERDENPFPFVGLPPLPAQLPRDP